MSETQKMYINREISWLSFNERVLQEAIDPTVPLDEKNSNKRRKFKTDKSYRTQDDIYTLLKTI